MVDIIIDRKPDNAWKRYTTRVRGIDVRLFLFFIIYCKKICVTCMIKKTIVLLLCLVWKNIKNNKRKRNERIFTSGWANDESVRFKV